MSYNSRNDILTSVNGTSIAGFRNRIINGDMRIDQANTGASIPLNTAGNYLVDQFGGAPTQNGKITAQQNAGGITPPAGFSNYLGFTSNSSYSVISTDYFFLSTIIEGLNIQDFCWGTPAAKTVTLSFKVYSSLAGSFGGSMRNAGSGGFRSFPFSYTVSTANTWTNISVTIPGDFSGTWATNNTAGIYVVFGLGVGSTFLGSAGSWSTNNFLSSTGATSVVGTNGATFYITAIQLEVGPVASSFEIRDYQSEVARCQRYLVVLRSSEGGTLMTIGGGYQFSTVAGVMNIFLPVKMRVTPSAISFSAVGDFLVVDSVVNGAATSFAINANSTGPLICAVTVGVTAGAVSRPFNVLANNTSTAWFLIDARL